MNPLALTLANGAFGRTSLAWWFDSDTQAVVEHAAGVARTEDVLAVGKPSVTLTDVVVQTDYHIGLMGNDGRFWYAVAGQDGAATYTGVWRCQMNADPAVAANWTKVSTDIDAHRIWYLPVQDLLLAVGWPVDRAVLYWSDDNGVNWTRCTLNGGNWDSEQINALFRGWEPHLAPNGTLLMPEGVSANGRKLCRSTDGKAWTTVHTAMDSRDAVNNHTHTCGYCAAYGGGAGRWVWQRGDGKYHRDVLVSDDDGLTWTSLMSSNEPVGQQAVSFIDYGDNRYLLAAADDPRGVYLVDCETGQAKALPFPVRQTPTGSYTFLLFEHGGVYYACSFTTTETTTMQRILVSTDRVNWVSYCNVGVMQGGPLMFAGYGNGKLLLGVTQSGSYYTWRLLTLTPARVASQNALVVEAGATNLLPEAIAKCTGSWSVTAGTRTYPAGSPLIGAANVKVDMDGAASCIMYYILNGSWSVNAGFGLSYFARGLVTHGTGFLYQYKVDGGDWTNFSLGEIGRAVPAELWRQIDALTRKVPAGGANTTTIYNRFDIEPSIDLVPNEVGILEVDGVMLVEGPPTSWHDPAAGARADEKINWTVDLPAQWSLSLDIRIRNPKASLDYANQAFCYILSLKKGAAVASLKYQVATGKLMWDYDPDGLSNSTLLTSDALEWAEQWHGVRIILRAGVATTKIAIEYGEDTLLEESSATPMSNLLGVAVGTIQNGDGSQVNQLGMMLAALGLYDQDLSDWQQTQILAAPSYDHADLTPLAARGQAQPAGGG